MNTHPLFSVIERMEDLEATQKQMLVTSLLMEYCKKMNNTTQAPNSTSVVINVRECNIERVDVLF